MERPLLFALESQPEYKSFLHRQPELMRHYEWKPICLRVQSSMYLISLAVRTGNHRKLKITPTQEPLELGLSLFEK